MGSLYAAQSIAQQPSAAFNTFVPPPSGPGVQYGNVQPSFVVQQQTAAAADDEPASKRQKTMEEQLVPEEEWLSIYSSKGPVKIAIQCPSVLDKPEWTLTGQTMNLPFDLTETVR